MSLILARQSGPERPGVILQVVQKPLYMQLFQVILYNIALHEELGERNEMNELIEVAGRSLFAPVAFAANPISRIAASKHLLPVWVSPDSPPAASVG